MNRAMTSVPNKMPKISRNTTAEVTSASGILCSLTKSTLSESREVAAFVTEVIQ